MSQAIKTNLINELAEKFASEITENYWEEAVEIADSHIAEGDDINWESVAEDIIDQFVTQNDTHNTVMYSMWLLIDRDAILNIVAEKLELFNDEQE